jgi:hypothetical protein
MDDSRGAGNPPACARRNSTGRNARETSIWRFCGTGYIHQGAALGGKQATPSARRSLLCRMKAEPMNNDQMSDRQVDSIGKIISTVVIGLLAALFAYAYLAHLVSR